MVVTEDEEYKRVSLDKFKKLSTVFQAGTSFVANVACDANNRLLLSESTRKIKLYVGGCY